MDFTTVVKKFKSEIVCIDIHRFFISDEGRNIWDHLSRFLDPKDQEIFWLAVMPKIRWVSTEPLIVNIFDELETSPLEDKLLIYFSKKDPKMVAKIFLEVMACWIEGHKDRCKKTNTKSIWSGEKPKTVLCHAWEHMKCWTRIKIFPKKQ